MRSTMPNTHLSHTSTSEYYRSTLKVTKQLRWLQLAEIEYCRVSNSNRNADDHPQQPGVGLRPRTFCKWEVAQRTTPASTATGNDGGDSSTSPSFHTHHQASAVEVLCLVKDHRDGGTVPTTKATPSYVVLVSQYRPPIDAISLEFPAGLVDTEDGSPAVTAVREMKEETGYEVTVPPRFLTCDVGVDKEGKGGSCYDPDAFVESVSTTPMSYDPGLTDSLFHLVEMKVHLRESNTATVLSEDADANLRIQRMLSNCNPVAELDGEEDIQVHLLPLDVLGGGSGGDPHITVGERLEQLRVRLGARTVVTGKVHTFVRGIDLARSM